MTKKKPQKAPAKRAPKLTPKQELFCQEYMKSLNATQAAIKAGYSKKTAAETGYENLRKPQIAERIQNFKNKVAERNDISIDEIVQILANMARFDIAELYGEGGELKALEDIPKEARESIAELTSFEEFGKDRESLGFNKKIKTINKLDAIEKLMKHLGGYEKDNGQKGDGSIVIIEVPNDGRN